jgi:hypothetical protein
MFWLEVLILQIVLLPKFGNSFLKNPNYKLILLETCETDLFIFAVYGFKNGNFLFSVNCRKKVCNDLQFFDHSKRILSNFSLVQELSVIACKLPDHFSTFSLNFPKIKKVDFSRLLLKTISDVFFNEISEITDLDLSHNQIIVLGDKVFINLPSLEWIDLSSNDFEILPQNLFLNNKNLRSFKLQPEVATKLYTK